MKQLAERATRGACPVPPNINLSALNTTTDSILIKEVETTVVTRERTYLVIRPVCSYCGEEKERIAAMTWICENGDCPSNDPAPAIPLPGETVIDVEPIKEAKAA